MEVLRFYDPGTSTTYELDQAKAQDWAETIDGSACMSNELSTAAAELGLPDAEAFERLLDLEFDIALCGTCGWFSDDVEARAGFSDLLCDQCYEDEEE